MNLRKDLSRPILLSRKEAKALHEMDSMPKLLEQGADNKFSSLNQASIILVSPLCHVEPSILTLPDVTYQAATPTQPGAFLSHTQDLEPCRQSSH